MHGRDLPQFKNLPIGDTTSVDGIIVHCTECRFPADCGGCHFNVPDNPNQICPIDFKMNTIGSKRFCLDVHRSDGKHVKYTKVRGV